MKFSLSTLILVILISALGVNLLLMDRKAKLIEHQLMENREQASLYKLELTGSEPFDYAGTQARALQQREDLRQRVKDVEAGFAQFAVTEGQLSINPTSFSIKRIPTTNTQNRHLFSYRVFVPNSMNLAAKIDFHESDSQLDGSKILLAEDFLFPLQIGESTLTLVYERLKNEDENDEYMLKLYVNDKTVKEWEVLSPEANFGISASYPFLRQQRDLEDFKQQKLVGNFSANHSRQRFDFLIVEVNDE